jgi:small subunit ribosomal protein S16
MYRIVVTERGNSREGDYVEMVGWYNPHDKDESKQIFIETDRVAHWMKQGAQVSETASALLEKVAPEVIRQQKANEVSRRAKALEKRKARKARKAAA